MLDLVIRNGTIVDGSGLASYSADVGIMGRRIVCIGRIRERGQQEIDAEGHVVSPGFIDGHTHLDAQIFWDPIGSCSCWNGVTTAVMGNCGFTLAPVDPAAPGLVTRNLERAEDISAEAMAAGIPWGWESFPQYLDAIDGLAKGINYAANIGHSALRTWAMGERAFEEEATEDDIVRMERELLDALNAGAIGFSTSRTDSHETADERPVASRLAAWSEVRRLVGVMGEAGRGIFEISSEPAAISGDRAIRDEYNTRLRDLAVETGVPMTFGVLPVGSAGVSQLELIDQTVSLGGRMFGQTHSRGISVVFSFLSNLPFDRIAEWREVRSHSVERQKVLLADVAVRRRLVEAAHRPQREVNGPVGQPAHFDTMLVYTEPAGSNPTVEQLAAERSIDPVELMIDLALQTDFHQLFLQPRHRNDEKELLELMRHPRAVMTFSDSGAHVSQIMDSSIQTYLLSHWVRERKAFALEEAVRMITLAPAVAWGFSDRGLLREGLIADINVFDPETICPELPQVQHDLPGGGQRLVQGTSGILATVVGGEVTLERGRSTGALPGELIRMRTRTMDVGSQ